MRSPVAQMQELLGAIDADGDGDISLAEFVTGVGMMKRAVLQATALAHAFEEIKRVAAGDARRGRVRRAASVMFESECAFGPSDADCAAEDDEEELAAAAFGETELEASDLERIFGVEREEAEEMIFLADITDRGPASRVSGSFDKSPRGGKGCSFDERPGGRRSGSFDERPRSRRSGSFDERPARRSGSFDERPASALPPSKRTIDSMEFKQLVIMWS